MNRFLLISMLLLCGILRAQPSEADLLDEDLDLILPDLPEATSTPKKTPQTPAEHLFAAFEQAPEAPHPAEKLFMDVADSELQRLTLPEAPYLVAPNPARVDDAYARLAAAVSEAELRPAYPLKVVLHADGNFSVALALQEGERGPLPLGTDLSPQPEMHLVGLWADIQVARRDHPLVLEAFVKLRRQAAEHGIPLDASELFFLPQAPGRVFFAVRAEKDTRPPGSKK